MCIILNIRKLGETPGRFACQLRPGPSPFEHYHKNKKLAMLSSISFKEYS